MLSSQANGPVAHRNTQYGSWRTLSNLTQTFRACYLCTFNVATIFWGAMPTYGVLLYTLIMWQSHVLLLWQQQCHCLATMLNVICVWVLVMVTWNVRWSPYQYQWLLWWWGVTIAMATETWNLLWCVCVWLCLIVSLYSLRSNRLTDTGAIALARALQHNKSLEELKWVSNWVSCYQEKWVLNWTRETYSDVMGITVE